MLPDGTAAVHSLRQGRRLLLVVGQAGTCAGLGCSGDKERQRRRHKLPDPRLPGIYQRRADAGRQDDAEKNADGGTGE